MMLASECIEQLETPIPLKVWMMLEKRYSSGKRKNLTATYNILIKIWSKYQLELAPVIFLLSFVYLLEFQTTAYMSSFGNWTKSQMDKFINKGSGEGLHSELHLQQKKMICFEICS